MPEADQAAAGYWYIRGDGPAPTPVSLLDALRRYRGAERRIRRRTCTAMGMNETDVLAVRHLLAAQREGRVVTGKDLARHLEISSASTTVLVDRLVRSGHAQRSRHPIDRRAIVVSATPASDRDVRAALGPLHYAMLAIAQSLPPEELRSVQTFLERMLAVVDAADHDRR